MNRKRLVIIFLLGVLVCGLGCGISFAQFSSFDYAGKKIIGSENTESKTLTGEISSAGYIYIDDLRRYYDAEVVGDDTVPANEIVFDITYNPDLIDPQLGHDWNINDGENERAFDSYYIYGYRGDDIQYFFEIKDEFLADIKEKKIGSYEVQDIVSVTVRLNPNNMNRLNYW